MKGDHNINKQNVWATAYGDDVERTFDEIML